MNLKQTILFSLATGFFVIGIHQIFVSTASDISGKIFDGYWAIMLSGGCFLAYKFLVPQGKSKDETSAEPKTTARHPQVKKKKSVNENNKS